MITGGKTFSLSPDQLARRIEVTQKATEGVKAASGVLREYWEAILRTGSGAPGSAPALRSGTLARSIRVTRRPAVDPTFSVGTPIFYGRMLHYGVPGRIEPRPHGDIALNAAEKDMNDAFRRAMQ